MSLTPAPRLETDRLIIRSFHMDDFDAFAEFHADPVRAPGFGEVYTRDQSWRWFACNIGHWHIHGYGYMTVEDKETGRPCGICGIWNPEGWPEPEIGWDLFTGSEGKGYATEAAEAARAYAYDVLGWDTVISLVAPENTASAAVAGRLGAVKESEFDHPHLGHLHVYRHPGPQDLVNGGAEAYA